MQNVVEIFERQAARNCRVLFVLLFQLPLVACSATSEIERLESTDPVEESRMSRTDPEMLERRQEMLQRKALEKIPTTPDTVVGEVPKKVMDTVMQALEQLTGGEQSSFEVVRAEETIWPDGALGCPQPGMVYTQAAVPGYHIVLEHDGREYDYRAGGTRYLMLCLEPGVRSPSGTTAPSS